MQRDVKIGIAIGVLLIALIGIFWWVRGRQPAVNDREMPPEMAGGDMMQGPISPVEPGNGGADIAGGGEILAPGVTTTTLPGAIVPPGGIVPGGIPPPPPPPPVVQTHTVVAGDSLEKISKLYYNGSPAKVKLIAAANQISVTSTLKIGQKLIIPPTDGAVTPPPDGGGVTPPPPPAAKTHKVVAGDTLTSISRKYYGDVTHVEAIYQANKTKMTSKNDLKVGMALTIP
jgi:nucleoid-associated protein YgaU